MLKGISTIFRASARMDLIKVFGGILIAELLYYMILIASAHPSVPLLGAIALELGLFALWLGYRSVASRTRGAKLREFVCSELLLQFPWLQRCTRIVYSTFAAVLGILALVLLVDLSALQAAKLHFFDYSRAVYGAIPTYRLSADGHPALSLEILSGACIEDGNFADAHAYTNLLLSIRSDVYGDKSWMYGGMLANLAGIYYKEGRFKDAENTYLRSLEICRDERGNHGLGSGLTRLGNSLREQGRFEEALDRYQEALSMRTREFGPMSLRVADTSREMALLMSFMKKDRECDRLFQRVETILSKRNTPESGNLILLVLPAILSISLPFLLFGRRGFLTHMVLIRLKQTCSSESSSAARERLDRLYELSGFSRPTEGTRGIFLVLCLPLPVALEA